jgi:putative membrane protein
MIKQFLTLLLKGMAMGAANVIPGVSGGTIALITGVFERLINAIKSFDIKAIKLLLTGQFKKFATYTDLIFLTSLFLGVGIAILSLAKLLDYLFKHQPVYVWAFFFGLVLASVWFVGKTVKTWHVGSVTTFIIGTAIALAISVMTPASENASFFYLIICGIVAICSMILPGLSGSFVLILMGNYQLIMIQAVSQFNFAVLLPVAIGCAIGLIAFSHFLSWLLKQFPDSTISLLTGFILGSLGILWPWKTELIQTFEEKTKVIGYQWHWPEVNETLAWAIVFIILGLATITVTEILGKTKNQNTPS